MVLLKRVGFTIIEILIAIVVLVLGITGIVALFPTAIESGNQTVEDTYAATITQSVVDAITVGLRESRYAWSDPANPGSRVWNYFLLSHDGILDPPVPEPEALDKDADAVWKKDYCVILPQAVSEINNNVLIEPIWIYPVPNLDGASGVSDAGSLSDQRHYNNLKSLSACSIDNRSASTPSPSGYQRSTSDGTSVWWTARTYKLGRYRDPGTTGVPLPSGMNVGDVRMEFLSESLSVVSGAATPSGDTIALDPYPTYSFAFTLQRARIDTNGPTGKPDGKITALDHFSNSLYELRVMIFKNFNDQSARELAPGFTGGINTVPRTNVPIRTFVTLISL